MNVKSEWSGAIKWIIEVVNLKISYQFYFGSWCSIWYSSLVFHSLAIELRRANRQWMENRVHFFNFLKYTMCLFKRFEREKDSSMYVYKKNPSDDCFLQRVESFWAINLLNWHFNIHLHNEMNLTNVFSFETPFSCVTDEKGNLSLMWISTLFR